MSRLTRRTIIGAAAGLGLSVVGIGSLVALRNIGSADLTATRAPVAGAASSAPAPATSAVATATLAPSSTPTAPTAPASVARIATPSPAASVRATPSATILSGGRLPTFVPVRTKGGTFVEVTIADATTNNPLFANDTSSADRTQIQYEGLLDLNPDNALPFGRLAILVPSRANGGISADGLTYTFKLRQGVKWSDGTPFTAQDVVYTYTTMQNPASGSPRAAELTDRIASVVAPDESTVTFTLKKALASFLVDNATYRIVPRHILKDVPLAALKTHPFSTGDPTASVVLGPFKLSGWTADRATFVKNATYYGGEPPLDRYVFRVVRDANAVLAALKAGDADFGTIVAPSWPEARQLPNVNAYAYPGYGFTYYSYQLDPAKTTLFADKRVRQALAYALDRDAMIKSILGGLGTPAQGTMPPFGWAYQPDKITTKYTYDPKKAEALLDAAGWAKGSDGIRAKDGKKLQFTIWTNTGGTTREQYTMSMQQQWKAIGVDATPKSEEWSAFLWRISQTKDFDLFLVGFSWGTDPDQSSLWSTDAYANGFNFGRYSNARVDDLLKQGLAEPDPDRRKALYLELQNLILDDAPAIILDFPHTTTIASKRIHNLTPNAVNIRWATHLWWAEDGK